MRRWDKKVVKGYNIYIYDSSLLINREVGRSYDVIYRNFMNLGYNGLIPKQYRLKQSSDEKIDTPGIKNFLFSIPPAELRKIDDEVGPGAESL